MNEVCYTIFGENKGWWVWHEPKFLTPLRVLSLFLTVSSKTQTIPTRLYYGGSVWWDIRHLVALENRFHHRYHRRRLTRVSNFKPPAVMLTPNRDCDSESFLMMRGGELRFRGQTVLRLTAAAGSNDQNFDGFKFWKQSLAHLLVDFRAF